jgi:hypothetical protein
MNEELRDLLDNLVDNAVEEYFLESQFITHVGEMNAEQRREVACYIHDRLVMCEIEPFLNASYERVERYVALRSQIHDVQKDAEALETKVNALMEELDDEGLIAQSDHLNG